ncbi:MAG: hypothetical protein ABIH87_01760 [bacterium]
MFGKKKQPDQPEVEEDIKARTIPADFYAGKDPVIEFKRVQKLVELKEESPLTPKEKQIFQKQSKHGQDKDLYPVNLFANKKFLIISGLSLFVVFIASASMYYWYDAKKSSQGQPTQIQIDVTELSVQQVVTTSLEDVSATSIDSMANTTTDDPIEVSSNDTVDFPSLLLGLGPDYDGDNLSDKAEEIFGTDPSIYDSDEDTFADGHEVFYLYNPNGIKPERLIDSGKVKIYVNPVYQYSLYYPADWQIGSVDKNQQDILFSTLNGENIEVRVIEHQGQSFEDWFSKWARDEKYAQLEDFTNVFIEKAKRRQDELVYYFIDDTYVYVIVYHAGIDNTVNYRSIITMMSRSFRSAGNEFVKQWATVYEENTDTSTVSEFNTSTESATTSS